MPFVSIIMSAYNDGRYLQDAIDSVLAQTYTDYELIIIDDASQDDTPEILHQQTDPRIVSHRNQQNLGLAGSLNVGLNMAQGKLIARADSDDVLVPNWLAEQIAYLESHPHVGMVCGNMVQMNAEGQLLDNGKPLYNHPATSGYLRWLFLLKNALPHNTVLMRRSVLEAHNLRYDPDFTTVEDHDLWSRLIQYTDIVRRQQVYVTYRIHSQSASRKQRLYQLEQQYRVVLREFQRLYNQDFTNSTALKTLFEVVQQFPTRSTYDYRGAGRLLVETYRKCLTPTLTTDERRYIQGDAVGYLFQLERAASSPLEKLYLLSLMRHISGNEFLSRNMLRRVQHAIFR